MSSINQLVVSASAHDAITNCARNARDVLARVGPSRLVASHVQPGLEDEVEQLSQADDVAASGDPILYHAAIGDGEAHRFLDTHAGRVVVWYHNLTPSRHFAAFDPVLARLLSGGRSYLARLARRSTGAMAVSDYNARDLEQLGFTDVRVSPLLLDTGRLTAVEPDGPTHEHIQRLDGPVLLFVGQLLPHKRLDLLLKAYDLLVTHYVPEAHLVLVGPQRSPSYASAIRRLGEELHLPRLWLAGDVSDAELAAFHRGASLVVTASEHEGFCVPLVEAMAFGTPIVATANGAIADTLGDGGLLLPADAGAGLLCEALLAVLEDGGLRQDLVARSSRRLAAYDRSVAERRLLANLAELL
ncbi:MAG: glycosyltransferase [Acidimicrobiales bacterium]